MYMDNSNVRLVTVNEDGSVEILFKDQTYMDIPKDRVEVKGGTMEKTVIEYDIPVNPDKEEIDKKNKDWGTSFRTTEEHIDELMMKLCEGIEKVGDEGGWYVGDGIKVKIELEYDPENK